MTVSDEMRRRIHANLNRDVAIDLLRRVVGTPSVTGEEDAVAKVLAGELQRIGLSSVSVKEFLPGRSNVWGIWPGAGSGRSLMLTGHIDTVHARGWEEQWKGTERESPLAAAIVDGDIWGRGVGDMKGGICAQIMALATLQTCGLRPKGDVVCVYVGDEESGEPHSGISAGMKAIASNVRDGEIPRTDFAIYAEPTDLNVVTAHAGFFIADLTITGRTSYFARPEHGIDALRATHAVLSALWGYSSTLEQRNNHKLIGRGFLLVTEISGGGSVAVPGQCKLSLIGKVPPGEDMDSIRREFEAAVASASVSEGITIAIDYPAARDHAIGGTPYELQTAHDVSTKLGELVETIRPGKGAMVGLPAWSEAPILSTAMGIPTIYFAAGDLTNCHTLEERVKVDDYFAAIEAYALFIAEFCCSDARSGAL